MACNIALFSLMCLRHPNKATRARCAGESPGITDINVNNRHHPESGAAVADPRQYNVTTH